MPADSTITLTIITINYNNKSGLKKTMESVINQAFNDIEYIVIDGGSTDGSLELIKEYADNIDYWVSEPDKGIYNAMNKGIVMANGEYLQFLNSGDCLVDELVVEKMMDRASEYDMVYGNCIMVYPDGRMVVDCPGGAEINFRTFFNATINHQASFIKRSLFYKYGLYDEQLKIASDWKFFLIAFGLNQAKTLFKNIDVVYYDRSGVSVLQKVLMYSERETVLSELIPYPIYNEYKNSQLEFIRLKIIHKHLFTAKLYRLSQLIIIRISRILDILKK